MLRRDAAKGGESVVCATAVSKCVFKSGRRTIAPRVMLRESGLLPPKDDVSTTTTLRVPSAVQTHISLSGMPLREEEEDVGFEQQKDLYELDGLPRFDLVNGNGWMDCQSAKESQSGGWTSDMIENERLRGMAAVANGGDLDDLERDFCADTDVLGRHFDL